MSTLVCCKGDALNVGEAVDTLEQISLRAMEKPSLSFIGSSVCRVFDLDFFFELCKISCVQTLCLGSRFTFRGRLRLVVFVVLQIVVRGV